MWIYIEDWSYKFGHWKHILSNGYDSNGYSPYIGMYPNTNSLHARIMTTVSKNEGCDITDLPLQKWIHIVYILENRNVNIYINNKLEKTCSLKGIPVVNQTHVKICENGGFYGKISRVQFFTKALDFNKINKLYYNGPFDKNKKYNIDLFDKTPFDVLEKDIKNII
jgi:hypothetical protein